MGKRGQRASERTLVCVIQALVGLELLVELRNDLSIRGVLDDCDNAMKYYHHLSSPFRFFVAISVIIHTMAMSSLNSCFDWFCLLVAV